jgi:hypothetical protein
MDIAGVGIESKGGHEGIHCRGEMRDS